uniref:Uncharacterized protein n=2 Tax=Aegilops tauschii subsp. strangulata TaxID=200361 RepID=A0A453P2N9_AEGTS
WRVCSIYLHKRKKTMSNTCNTSCTEQRNKMYYNRCFEIRCIQNRYIHKISTGPLVTPGGMQQRQS